MTFLAKTFQVVWRIIRRIVVKMGDGQHNFTSRDWMWFIIHRTAGFATILRSLQNLVSDVFPVRRVFTPIYWHILASLYKCGLTSRFSREDRAAILFILPLT